MLGIIICDDDKFTLALSTKMAKQCINENGFSADVVCMSTSFKEIISFLNRNKGLYLYFLDIDFGKGELNGIDMAKLIKEHEPLSKIVFVTSHADMGMNVLKSGVEAFGFIEKTMEEHKMIAGYKKYIALAIERTASFLQEKPKDEQSIQLMVGIDEFISLPISQILYVESAKTVSHFVCYHTVDGSSISVRDTIENVLTHLGDGFIKSHRSVVINISHVLSVSDGVVNFVGGETASCSFRLKNEIIRKCKVGRV